MFSRTCSDPLSLCSTTQSKKGRAFRVIIVLGLSGAFHPVARTPRLPAPARWAAITIEKLVKAMTSVVFPFFFSVGST